MAKETLTTIAERLGLSVTTVSRVLSGNAAKFRISKATAKIIEDEAKRCNYMTSLVAQSLRTNKTGTIGLLLPSVANPFFADIASIIISEAHKKGKTTIVADAMEDPVIQKENIRNMLSRKVDGIIAVPCGDDAELLEEIDREHLPVVLIDRYYEGTDLSYVTTNNHLGGLIATRHLLQNGHRKIACIQGVSHSMPNSKRVSGYEAAMKDAGLEDCMNIVGSEFSILNGYLETKLLLGGSNRPTALFALSNTIALGAIKAIRESGLSIPEDISLISFDNNMYLDYMNPPVSRIGQPVEDMAVLALKLLFDRIGGTKEQKSSTHLSLSPVLVTGGSVLNISLSADYEE